MRISKGYQNTWQFSSPVLSLFSQTEERDFFFRDLLENDAEYFFSSSFFSSTFDYSPSSSSLSYSSVKERYANELMRHLIGGNMRNEVKKVYHLVRKESLLTSKVLFLSFPLPSLFSLFCFLSIFSLLSSPFPSSHLSQFCSFLLSFLPFPLPGFLFSFSIFISSNSARASLGRTLYSDILLYKLCPYYYCLFSLFFFFLDSLSFSFLFLRMILPVFLPSV